LLLDLIVSCLINGSVYASLALGFSLIFGAARIVNLAHTAFYMLAAFCLYAISSFLGLNLIAGMVISIVLLTIIGLLSYKFIIEPIREHMTAVLIGTIALATILQELLTTIFGADFLSVPPLVTGFITISKVKITYQQCLSFISVFFILLFIWIILKKTKLGLAIRATALDREVVNLMGIDEAKIAMITAGISIGLAAFTGVIIVPLKVLHTHMWITPLIFMMAVVVLGGLGSMKGSIIGAFFLSFIESIVVFLIPMGSFIKEAVALAILIIVLIIRPAGFFGIRFEGEE